MRTRMLQPVQMMSGDSSLPKKCLYLLYEPFGFSKYCHYLYKMDIDLTTTTATAPRDLSPILMIENGERTRGMRCARLGSKFYFLGGEKEKDYGRYDYFSRDVYVLDMLRSDFKMMDAPLNAGKRNPVIFAVNGKLYVLASIPANIPSAQLSPMKLFECFDPCTSKWQLLDNLPPMGTYKSGFIKTSPKGIDWAGCTVLEKRQQVVLLGWESPMYSECCENVAFVYHLQQNNWTRHKIPSNPRALSLIEGGNYLYGLHGFSGPPLKIKTECASEINLLGIDVIDGLTEMSIANTPTVVEGRWAKWVVDYFGHPYVDTVNSLVRYLGNDIFCYITSGELRDPDGPDSDGEEYSIPFTQGITITFFMERKENQGGEEKQSFQADILHSEEYLFKTPDDYNSVRLVECFIIDPEKQQKKLDQRKDKKKKKNKKKKNVQ